ncbi:MAG: TlpA family protein disulfide reductase [Planctomycetes bacterium]|nr:TlpA family protein disulfide reductase [Planctomycetota bacterium]
MLPLLLAFSLQFAVYLGVCYAQEAVGTSPAKETASNSNGNSGTAQVRNPLERIVIDVVDGFGEGWKQTVPVKSSDDPCDSYNLWVKDGWLYVRRTDESGDLDWQIKLAEARRIGVPSISMIGEGIGFHVSSEDGRFFIRETTYLLRTVRQRSEGDGAIPHTDLLSEDFRSSGYCRTLTITLSGWRNESWFYAASGPDKERFNCLIRLNPLDMWGAGNGFQSVAGELAYIFHGKTHVWDDGELLLASRTLRASYERELVRRRILESLPGSIPPEIDASQWMNTNQLTWKDLQGKVVLLDFWATWCSPCVKKLPHVQELADKFADQGLVVIGIHSENGSDTCAEFVAKAKLTFPIAVDTGTTEKRYAIEGVPKYFLIDKTGHVVDGYAAEVPDEETIRNLLAKEVRVDRGGKKRDKQ